MSHHQQHTKMTTHQLRDLLSSLGSSDLTPESFVRCSNALLKLNARNIHLSKDIEIPLRYKRLRFKVRHTVQTPEQPADSDLADSIDSVVTFFEPLKLHGNDVLNVDDETLLRLRLVMAELCFLETREEMAFIPLKEMASCMAMFILVFEEKSECWMFRLVVNRVNIIRFLRAVVSRLEDYRSGRIQSKCYGKVLKKLVRTYGIVQKLYILNSVQKDLSAILSQNSHENVKLAALHAVLGNVRSNEECFKEPINLFKLLEPYFENPRLMLQRLMIFDSISKILLFLQLNKVFKTFLHIARCCQSSVKLRSLFRYVENVETLRQEMKHLLEDETGFYGELNTATHLGSFSKNLKGEISRKLESIHSLKSLVHFKLPCFNRLLYDEHFKCDNRKLEAVIDSTLSEMKEVLEKCQIQDLWLSLEAEISIVDPLGEFIVPSSHLKHKRNSKFIVANLRSTLFHYKFLSIDSIVHNSSNIPRVLNLALRYWISEYFKPLEDQTFTNHELNFPENCDPGSSMEVSNPNLNNLILALVLTETPFEEILKSQVEQPSGLKKLRIDGLFWVQSQKEKLNFVRNLDADQIKSLNDEDLRSRFLLCLENAKGPSFYTLETVLGYSSKGQPNNPKICSKFISIDLLSIALGLLNYSKALPLCPEKIDHFDEIMFAWSDLISSLVVSGVDLTAWSLETVEFVVEKLVKFDNSQCLEHLSNYHVIPDIVSKAISTGDESFVTKVFKNHYEAIRDDHLTEAIKTHLNDSILSILESVDQNRIEFILYEAIRLNNYNLIEVLISIKSELIPHAFQVAARNNRVRVVRQLLHQPNASSAVDKALYTAIQLQHWKVASAILKCGQADPNARFDPEYSEYGILIRTAFQGAVARRKLGFCRKFSIDVELSRDLSLVTLAAATVSVDLIRFLVKLGFSVVDEVEVVPCILAIGYSRVWEDTVENLQLKAWVGPSLELSELYLQVEKWKILIKLEQLVYCEEFQKSASLRLKRTVARRIKLYKTYQDEVCVKKVDATNIPLELFQRNLKNFHVITYQLKRNFHFYSSDNQQYAFCELTLLSALQSDIQEGDEDVVKLSESNITPSVVLESISTKLGEVAQSALIRYEIRLFDGDTIATHFLRLQLNSSAFSIELQIQSLKNFFDVQNLSNDLRNVVEDISNENLFQLAIGGGDVLSLAELLQSEKEFIKLHPELFNEVVDFNGKVQKTMAVMLLEVGLKSWTLNPKLVHSIIDYAINKNQFELVQLVLSYDCFGLTADKEFEKVIQYDSVEIFEVFLKMTSYNEVEIFQHVSNALQCLSCKNVEVGEELQTFLQYQLSSFGFKHLCADSKTSKNYSEWLSSIDFVIEWTQILQNREDCNSFLGVNNEVLFRLRMIHNQLYLIKDCAQLRKIPLREMTFLLAVFVTTFKEDDFAMYRVVVNKPKIMKFLAAITVELDSFRREFQRISTKMKHLMKFKNSRVRSDLEPIWKADASLPNLSDNIWNRLSSRKFKGLPYESIVDEVFQSESIEVSHRSKSSKVFQKITQTFFRVKQMYSLCKIAKSLNFTNSLILTHEQTAQVCQDQSGSKECYVAVIKRFTQIFGECIKSTTNTPNIPKKISRILETMLWSDVRQNKQTRDVTCHKFPLIRKFLTARDLFLYYTNTPKYLSNVEIAVKILIVFTCFEYFRWFFDSLLRCSSVKVFRELIRYVGELTHIIGMQTKLFDDIKKFCQDNVSAIDEKLQQNCSYEIRELLKRTKDSYAKRESVLKCLEKMQFSNFFYNYDVLQAVAFSTKSIQMLHRMVELNFAKNRVSNDEFFHLLTDNWTVLRYEAGWLVSQQMTDLDMISMGSAQRLFEIDNGCMQEYYCREEVEQICTVLLEECEISAEERQNFEIALSQKLDKTYFKDIFLLDSKFDAIDKVFSKRKLRNFERKVKQMRKENQKELCQIIKQIKSVIKQVLSKNNCETIEKLIKNFKNISKEHILAIEFWILELSEILISTKQFQDNFHTIKKDVQMICGRNFRNYLAHDSISYDLLTNSSRIKVLVNALVISEIDWQLFGEPEKCDLPEVKNVTVEGVLCIENQNQLKNAVLEQNSLKIEKSLERGASLLGKFWQTTGPYSGVQILNFPKLLRYRFSTSNCTKLNSLMEIIDYDNISETNSQLYQLINENKFEQALLHSKQPLWSTFFDSCEFPMNFWRCLGRLSEHLNNSDDISAILDLLCKFGSEMETIIMLICDNELNNVISAVKPGLLQNSEIHSIVRSDRLEDLQNMDFLMTNLGSNFMSVNEFNMLQQTISCNNIFAFKFILKNIDFSCFKDFENILISCVILGRIKMIEILLEIYVKKSFDINRALQVAAAHHKWAVVKFLHSKGASLVQIDDFRKVGTAFFKCLKYLQHFPVSLPESYLLQVELPNVAKFSISDMELLLKAGYDILRYKPFFRYVLQSDNDEIITATEKLIFEFKREIFKDEHFQEWHRILQEAKILSYLTIDLLNLCMRTKLDLFCRIMTRIRKFGTTAEGFGIEIINEFGYEMHATKTLDLCLDMQKCLENFEQQTFQIQFEREVLFIDSQENVEAVTVSFKLNSIEELSNIEYSEQIAFAEDNLTINLIYKYILQILNDLKISDYSTLVTAEFELYHQSYRLLKIASNFILLRISPTLSPIEKMLNTKDITGATILFGASNLKAFTLLIENGADLSVENNDDESALFGYTTWPWPELAPVFNYCIQKGVCNSKQVHLFHAQSSRKITVLAVAASNGAAEAVHFLVTYGADHTLYDCGGMFPLYMAVHMQRINVVEVLLNHSTETVNKCCENVDLTPMFQAVSRNNAILVKMLLDHGADLGMEYGGSTIFGVAMKFQANRALKVLLQHAKRNDLKVVTDYAENTTVIQWALLADDVEMFQIVLESEIGGSIDELTTSLLESMKKVFNEPQSDGFCLFALAKSTGSLKIVEFMQTCAKLGESFSGEPFELENKINFASTINWVKEYVLTGRSGI